MAKKKTGKVINPDVATSRRLVDAWVKADTDNDEAMVEIVKWVDWARMDARTTKRVLEIIITATTDEQRRTHLMKKIADELKYAEKEYAISEIYNAVYDATKDDAITCDVVGKVRALAVAA